MMKCELFFDTALLLLEEFQQSKEYCNMPKLIITTLSTFIKHQQASSRLAKRVDRHTLNNKLIAFFTQPAVHEEYRLLLVKSYTQFVFSPGSKPRCMKWRPSEGRLSRCSATSSACWRWSSKTASASARAFLRNRSSVR